MGEPTSRSIFCDSRADFGNNAPSSDINRPNTLQLIPGKCAPARDYAAKSTRLLVVIAAISACSPAAKPEAASVNVAAEPALQCGETGALQAQLYGAISATLDWDSSELECTGMPRPEGHGARLRFAGTGPGAAQRVAIIIAIPDLTRAALGAEYRSNVTVIEEGAGRFFNTPDLDNCLTDITMLTALDAAGDQFSIGGALYCVTPLPEVNGDSSVSFSDIRFTGLIDWSSS